ncbi:hypothetical protein FDG92_gp06 [Arthrobacter phage Jasmine]|uniref:Uncharacterized protein n=1 Tax=Arthrobacter phage Jasmine TaxID=1772302 RepID=A0A0U4B3J4_9CAUD|nr:hypothetical protein FDG92_gp06 [Arthrobacter phage Jasmine]ALY09278.1 hypothetical protein JASMINE_6 [Arthrobacter phage Jasmine]
MATMKLIIEGSPVEITPTTNISMYEYLVESGMYKLMEEGKATYPIHLPNGYFVEGIDIS